MPKKFVIAALCFVSVIGFGFVSTTMQSNQADHSAKHNPLPPCKYTTNCILESRAFSLVSEKLSPLVEATLREMNAADIKHNADRGRFDAVFSAGFIFRDDVQILIVPDASNQTSMLHIRSSSRVGRGDFGANSRRVRRFFSTLMTKI